MSKFLPIFKRYILTFIVSLLLLLLLEWFYYPFTSAQLSEDASMKTTGSIMVLTDETPQELRVYHRAFLMPRYRLDSADKLPEPECMTANVDNFQTFVISIENRQIVLYDLKANAQVFKISLFLSGLLSCFIGRGFPFTKSQNERGGSYEKKDIDCLSAVVCGHFLHGMGVPK